MKHGKCWLTYLSSVMSWCSKDCLVSVYRMLKEKFGVHIPLDRAIRRTPGHCQEKGTAVVWSCFKIKRPGQDDTPRYSWRIKKKRTTEKEMVRQHQRVDERRLCHKLSPKQRPAEMEGAVQTSIVCGDPTTTLWVTGPSLSHPFQVRSPPFKMMNSEEYPVL